MLLRRARGEVAWVASAGGRGWGGRPERRQKPDRHQNVDEQFKGERCDRHGDERSQGREADQRQSPGQRDTEWSGRKEGTGPDSGA